MTIGSLEYEFEEQIELNGITLDAYFSGCATIESDRELVKALEDLIECCEKQRAFTNPDNVMTTGRLRLARAALAKAKQP